jgi:hypothetical protein
MDNKLTELSFSVYSNKGAFALLLGSGVSRPAGIPTGWEIALDLIRQIAILEKKGTPDNPEKWFQEYFKEELDYSNILEKLTKTSEERVNLLKRHFEPSNNDSNADLKRPTIAHQRIAQLVQDGYIKVIVTTNFDRLIENSLKDLGIEPVVISNPAHVEHTVPLIHSRITVIKINGDYLNTNFLNIKSELNEYDNRIKNLLTFIFENFGLISAGWSAKWDNALVHILKSSNKFRYSNYFLYTNNYSKELEELSNHRRATLVKIQNADKAFEELSENIKALENNFIENPLSSKIVIARIRKYLPKEEHLISLSEIVQNVVEDSYKKVNSISFPNPTEKLVKETFEHLNRSLNLLIPVLIEGGFWSKIYHSKIWYNAIKRIGTPKDVNSTYTIWSELLNLPLTQSRYAFGIAALANDNWGMLKMSTEINFSNQYGRDFESLLKKTHILRVIERNNINHLLGQNYRTPMSEYIFNELKPHFDQLIPSEKDYSDTFDYYEFICCLLYLREDSNDYPPIGRFGWRDRYFINFKLAKFNSEGDDFELIKAGLFKNVDELKPLVAKLNERLKNERF